MSLKDFKIISKLGRYPKLILINILLRGRSLQQCIQGVKKFRQIVVCIKESKDGESV